MDEANKTDVKVFSPALPKGGGSIQGMGESLTTPGSDGMISFRVPLSLTQGRTITPSLSLEYNSASGNGPFGMGWQLSLNRITRRTSLGIPKYTEEDEFIGPNGEILIPKVNNQGQAIVRYTNQAQGVNLGETFKVSSYYQRNESNFDRIEYWQATHSQSQDFWIIYGADGAIHCLGKNQQARITNPNDNTKIAEWLLEESLSPYGEHIYYKYKKDLGHVKSNVDKDLEPYTNSYLKSVHYGNKKAYSKLYILSDNVPNVDEWLYTVIFDYGEHATPVTVPSTYSQQYNWLERIDSFSIFNYGFELRTCRLCQQVLVFHNFDELGPEPALVSRVKLRYLEHAITSTLATVQTLAYSSDGTKEDMPPLEFGYSKFNPHISSWSTFDPIPNMQKEENYQLVDLYGEGIPGILAQNPSGWYYREPMRDKNTDDMDKVTYNSFEPLKQLPVPHKNGALIDLNGDGHLEWLVNEGSVTGSYTILPDKTFSTFIPTKALPTEFFHPQAQLASVTGSPFTDLVMIGPKSVRFYAGEENGFKKSQEVLQRSGVTLPFNSINEKELVAFSDMLGSGQQHLVKICHNKVTCWPNIGYGKFGSPRILPGFAIPEKDFNPNRVYLADINGTGAADLLYVKHDKILLYSNLSGNGFANPIDISLPNGVYFDDLCQLIPADVNGQGVNDLILSVPHMKPSSWCLSLSRSKPYLLTDVNNNIGMGTKLEYRSSAQYWLDEKGEDDKAICALPFPVNVISSIKTIDEQTGHYLEQSYTYRRGVYDNKERAYAGFGLIDTIEKHKDSKGKQLEQKPPVKTRTWYHTGREEDDTIAISEYWNKDPQAFSLKDNIFTTWNIELEKDIPLNTINEQQKYWLYRSLTGMTLRVETYLENDSTYKPCVINSMRYQVRLVQNTSNYHVVLPLLLEQLTYNYEQTLGDPQCSQQIQQFFDAYGYPTQNLTINYPRRTKPNISPYPDSLPITSWNSSYDDQQEVLRITRNRQAYYHVINSESQRLGISHQTRNDTFTYNANNVPSQGISNNSLDAEGLLPVPYIEHAYGGQTEVVYVGEDSVDTRALPYFNRTSVYDEESLKAYDNILNSQDLQKKLIENGYVKSPTILGSGNEADVYIAEQGFIDYLDESGFYNISSQQISMLTEKQTYTWDKYNCVIIETKDALNNKVQLTYDYRFLQPYQLVDINENINRVQFDAFGRVLYAWNWGTENGTSVGFPMNPSFIPPKTVDEALEMKGPLPVAGYYVYNNHSWMGNINIEQIKLLYPNWKELWEKMVENGIILEDGQILSKVRTSIETYIPVEIRNLLINTKRQPVHTAVFLADNYPDNPNQQVSSNITCTDGFNRIIQSAQLAEPGLSYMVDESGKLLTDITGLAQQHPTEIRWTITDHHLYDASGSILKEYQPFFANYWHYTNNDSVSSLIDTTSYYYDSLGRIVTSINAKGYQRRSSYFPWFVMEEDENDTQIDTMYSGTPTINVFDNRGLVIRTLEYNRRNLEDNMDELITRNTYTLLGYLSSSIDPRLFTLRQVDNKILPNETHMHTLIGTTILTKSVDSGRVSNITNIEGELAWYINANNVQTTISYDILGRKTALFEHNEQGETSCRDRLIYGESEPMAINYNKRGNIIRHYDAAGLVTMDSYTVDGKPLTEGRQLLFDLDQPTNWQTDTESNWRTLLNTTQYQTVWEYNALGLMFTQTDAKGNKQVTQYDIKGQVKNQSIALAGQVAKSVYKQMRYNAAGQTEYIESGNGVITTHTYETSTQRLTDTIVKRPLPSGGMEVLQALHYEYDPVGNVILREDKADKTQYIRNKQVKPINNFTYDSLYQLVTSTGREFASNNTGIYLPDPVVPISIDSSQYINYKKTYYYDRGKNLTQIKHIGANTYTTDMNVSNVSNRAAWKENDFTNLTDTNFDAAGNLQELVAGIPLEWNSRNQLTTVRQIVRDGGVDDRESYTYDGTGFRIVKRTIRKAGNTTNITTVIYLPGLEIRTKHTNSTIIESLHVVTAADGVKLLHWENETQPKGIQNNQYRYSTLDNIGSNLLELDDDAKLISKEEYYPFGGTAIWAARSLIEADYKTIRYSGKERDATGLYYYGYRYYMPWIGRWLNPDPIGSMDGLNVYCMVGNNPVTSKDLYGLVGKRGKVNNNKPVPKPRGVNKTPPSKKKPSKKTKLDPADVLALNQKVAKAIDDAEASSAKIAAANQQGASKIKTKYDDVRLRDATVNHGWRLKSNIEYTTPDGDTYTTDYIGRLDTVHIPKLTLLSKKGTGKRDNYAQLKVGYPYRQPSYLYDNAGNRNENPEADDGGHIRGTRFNGLPGIENMVAQSRDLNRSPGSKYSGRWFELETKWEKDVKNNDYPEIKVKYAYTGFSLRPDSYDVSFQYLGQPLVSGTIKNKKGGF